MTLKAVQKVVASYGATMEIDRTGDSVTTLIAAPAGSVWLGAGVHELVDSVFKPFAPDWNDMLDRMSFGLGECPDGADCEWCNHQEDDAA